MKPSSKRIALVLVFVLLGTFLFSCSAGTTEDGIEIPNGMQAITSEAKDYELFVPSSWLVETTVGMTSAYTEDRTRSNISVCANEISGEITTAAAYWDLFCEQFTATFPDFAVLDAEPADVVIGSAYESNQVNGLKYRYTATVGGVQYQWMQVLFARNATMYIFTYTATAEAYESHLDDINNILAHFYFR